MFLRKICFFCFLCVILSHISYAQELTAAEAVNYYNEGVRAQKNGDFDTAMKAYQKALLLSSYYNKFCLNNQAAIYAQVGDYKRA
jgi:tetratricopeptide (TPR) repeat protein